MAHDHTGEHAHTTGAPPGIVSLVRSIEAEDRLDVPAAGLSRLTEPLGRPGPRDVLTGAWLGHALHPLLTDFPLGAFMSATLLDLFGGPRSQAAAQGLVAFGVAMTVPTVASGLAEWRETGPRSSASASSTASSTPPRPVATCGPWAPADAAGGSGPPPGR